MALLALISQLKFIPLIRFKISKIPNFSSKILKMKLHVVTLSRDLPIQIASKYHRWIARIQEGVMNEYRTLIDSVVFEKRADYCEVL